MTTLRILVTAADALDAPLPWALYDDAGACTATGRDAPSGWPAADVREAVVGAALVRLASVTLPPVPAPRLAAAVAYALEDRIAGAADEPWLAPSPQQPGGGVVVAIVARAFMTALRTRAADAAPPAPLTRVLAEPELAAVTTDLAWCVPDASAAGTGFVRMPDGSAFPVDARGADGELPAELRLALTQAARNGPAPASVRVDATVTDAALDRWQRETGVAFARGTPWRWHAAPPATFARATNLLQREMAPTAAAPAGSRSRSFAPALWLLVAAIAIHIAATAGTWTWSRIDAWRTARAWTALATAAGISASDAATPSAARAALARRYADERHAHGLPAPGDALPLLARAAPALSALPPGALKSAIYADGFWTLDLQRADPTVLRELDARLRRAGTPALIATTASGARLRIGAY